MLRTVATFAVALSCQLIASNAFSGPAGLDLVTWSSRSKDRKRLPEQVEEIIAATFRGKWLTFEPTAALAPVVDEIRARCEEAGLAAPSYVTVAWRIPVLFLPKEIMKKRSANPKHLLRLNVVSRSSAAARSMAVSCARPA